MKRNTLLGLLRRVLLVKVYVWVLLLIALVAGGFFTFGKLSSIGGSGTIVESYSMVKYIEQVNETVFLNVGIQKVDTLRDATDILGFEIPFSEKKAIIILNYDAKIGIKKPISVEKKGENHFNLVIPKMEVIGISLDEKHPYNLYDRSGELLSYQTKEIDTGRAVAASLSNKEQKQYLKKYLAQAQESTETYYRTLFESAYPGVELDFEFH